MYTAYPIGTAQIVQLPSWLRTDFPPNWFRVAEPRTFDDWLYHRVYRQGNHLVILSCARYADNKSWLHVSVSRKDRKIPSWQTMSLVKKLFIGEERTAYQIMPPAAKHGNSHPAVLHLWHCLDGDVTPDFTGGGETI